MNLTLADEFLLLSLKEEDGKPLIGTVESDAGTGGALLVELALTRRVRLDGDRVAVTDTAPLGDGDLDAALARIEAERKPRKADWWVSRLSGGGLRKRRLARLAELGVLTAEEHRLLGVIKYRLYPERDAAPERELRLRLDRALAADPVDERTAALLAVAHACRLDRRLFPDRDRKDLDRRVTEITEGQWAGQAIARVISSVQAGIMAVTVAGAAATITTG